MKRALVKLLYILHIYIHMYVVHIKISALTLVPFYPYIFLSFSLSGIGALISVWRNYVAERLVVMPKCKITVSVPLCDIFHHTHEYYTFDYLFPILSIWVWVSVCVCCIIIHMESTCLIMWSLISNKTCRYEYNRTIDDF